MALQKIYALEPFMHNGNPVEIGSSIDADQDEVAAILSSGRGTLDAAKVAAATKSVSAAVAKAEK